MRSRLIIALFLLIGLLFPMLPEQGGRAAAPSSSGRSTCASRIPVRANARPDAAGTGLGSFLPQDTTAAARDTARRRAPARTPSSSLPELTMPQVIPPSPAAMELAKYTAYPVDLSNGLVTSLGKEHLKFTKRIAFYDSKETIVSIDYSDYRDYSNKITQGL
jgi:hypothetical protein